MTTAPTEVPSESEVASKDLARLRCNNCFKPPETGAPVLLYVMRTNTNLSPELTEAFCMHIVLCTLNSTGLLDILYCTHLGLYSTAVAAAVSRGTVALNARRRFALCSLFSLLSFGRKCRGTALQREPSFSNSAPYYINNIASLPIIGLETPQNAVHISCERPATSL